jgi:hypothetical protein
MMRLVHAIPNNWSRHLHGRASTPVESGRRQPEQRQRMGVVIVALWSLGRFGLTVSPIAVIYY